MFSISEVAARTGFSPATLRYYDQIGLVRPAERSAAGYRRYDDTAIERLRFVERTKSLGFSLDEVAEIADLLDGRECAPVQERLRQAIQERIVDTQQRATEMIATIGELQSAAARLGVHTPEGACDDQCGCATDAPMAPVGVALIATGGGGTEPPIACTLDPANMGDRMTAWQAALAHTIRREPIDGGIRLALPRDTDLAAVAQLVADEQTCCTFFTFSLTISRDQVTLDVTAPPEAQTIVNALVGSA